MLSLSCYAFNSLTITPACFVNVPLLVLQLLYTGLTEHFYFKNRCRFVDLGHRWFCGFTWLSTSQMLMSLQLIFYALKMLWTKETRMYSESGSTTANALLLWGFMTSDAAYLCDKLKVFRSMFQYKLFGIEPNLMMGGC